jgi:diguanylate cyclase (GGDEF)-like protein
MCDLDGFKRVNDSRGHQFGDGVLKSVATTLRQATRGTDLHFRWGGDEMVVVLSKSTEDGALIAAERIRQGVRGFAAEHDLDLDTSIGIAIYPIHGTTDEELIRVADLAMYVAKKTGDKMRVGFEEYTVNEDCVTFAYQPIWNLGANEIVGHEVFTRDPGGVLGPVELFQRYRAVGQLRRLKRLVFELQVRSAQDAGVRRLFLNSDLEFLHGVTPPPIPDGLEVVLELSELDSSSSDETRIAVVFEWRKAGYRIALDDFGAGYASLPILGKLAPDFVKIDRTCIVRATRSERYRDFLRHLLKGATEYTTEGLIAEGVELPGELDVARELGARFAQGFLLGRPASTAQRGTLRETTRAEPV